MKKQVRISDLCSHLESRYYSAIDFEENGGPQLSPDSIAAAARAKMHSCPDGFAGIPAPEERSNVRAVKKKMPLRIGLIAAAVCLLSVTAFAAAGGPDFFKSIFGSSAKTAESDIRSPRISASDENYKMTVESLLSDGYKTDLVVSLKSLKGKKITADPFSLFSVSMKGKSPDADDLNYSCEALDDFSGDGIYYYHIQTDSMSSCLASTFVVSEKEEKSLKVEVPVEYSMAVKTVAIPAQKYQNKNYRPEGVQLSSLGVMVIGSEKKEAHEIPNPEVSIQMKDGSKIQLLESNVQSDSGESNSSDAIRAQGEVILDPVLGQQMPLVTEMSAERNPGDKSVVAGYFTRILNLDDVKSILVDNTEYLLQ